MLSGLKDIDRKILNSIDDSELLKVCSISKRMWIDVCDDNFLRLRLMKYPGIEEYKSTNETWKYFFSSVVNYVLIMKESYDFHYVSGDFKKQYDILKKNKKYTDLLLHASLKGEIDLIKHAVKKGADIHYFHEESVNLAGQMGHSDLVKWLVQNGACKNAALTASSFHGHINIVKWLIDTYIHIDTTTALQYASKMGHLNIVKMLIEEYRVDIHCKNDTALRYASEEGKLEVVKYLVENGADIHAKNDEALIWASEEGHLEVVKFLIESGVDVHTADDYAIRSANENNYVTLVRWLLENGANIHALRFDLNFQK